MRTVNIHEAKTHLSRLVDQAAGGEAFVIAKAGKPMVKVVAIHAEAPKATQDLGFLAGRMPVPGDFERAGVQEAGTRAFGLWGPASGDGVDYQRRVREGW